MVMAHMADAQTKLFSSWTTRPHQYAAQDTCPLHFLLFPRTFLGASKTNGKEKEKNMGNGRHIPILTRGGRVVSRHPAKQKTKNARRGPAVPR